MEPKNCKEFPLKDWKASKKDDGSLVIRGWVSTDDLDDYNDIVEPTAFAPVIEKYLKKPIVLWMHQFYDLAIGKTLSLEIIDTPRNEEPYGKKRGLWGEVEILGTTMGKDVQILIENDVVNSFSYWFDIAEGGANVTNIGGQAVRVISEFSALFEISVCNLGADFEAIFEKAKNLNLKSLTKISQGRDNFKEVRVMPPEITEEKVQTMVADSVDPLSKDIKGVTVTVGELKKQFDDIMVFKKEMEDMKGRTESEVDEKVGRMEKDFKAKLDNLTAEFDKVKERNQVAKGFGGRLPKNIKALVHESTARLKAHLPDNTFGAVDEFRKCHDDLLLLDSMLEASAKKFGPIDGLGNYDQRPKHERIKSLKAWKEFDEFRKAMDSTTATEGDEWVPTGLSREMIEKVNQKIVVAGLFDEFFMPTNPFEISAEGDDTEAVIASEITTVQTARADSTEQTPGTGKVTFSAEKLRGRYQISRELTEDSAVAIMPFARKKLVRSMASAEDQAIENGQETADIDTGYGGIGATSAKKLVDGLRYNTQTAAKVDLSTFTVGGLRDMRAKMVTGGPYGQYPDDLAYLCSLRTYLKHFMKDITEVQTPDKYGPNATILKGELLKIDGISIVITGYIQDNLNAAGIYDATTTDKSIVQLVFRDGFRRGVRRQIEVMSEYNMFFDVYDLVVFKRLDFQPVYTAASNYIISEGYGVS